MVFSSVYARDPILIRTIHSTVILNCGLHTCPSKCHQLYDHSKMPCQYIRRDMRCSNGHVQTWRCHEILPSTCIRCERANYAGGKDLKPSKSCTSQAIATSPIFAGVSGAHSTSSPPASFGNSQPVLSVQDTTRNPPKATRLTGSVPTEPEVASPSQQDWERRKKVDGASNDAIDNIMELIGLEQVKEQVLSIYAKMEITKRQGIPLNERFNIVLLGNPGTGWS